MLLLITEGDGIGLHPITAAIGDDPENIFCFHAVISQSR